MIEQIRELFERVSMTPAALPLAFVLGLAGQLVRTQLGQVLEDICGLRCCFGGFGGAEAAAF